MTVNESLLRDILRLIVWYPIRWLVLVLPVRSGLALFQRMGDIHFQLAKSRKKLLLKNLSRISPEYENPQEVVRKYFQNHYVDRLFIFLFPRFGRKEVNQFIEFRGLDHLIAALSKGNGAILMHPHFGPVHLPLVALAVIGYPMKQVGNPSDEGLSRIGRQVAFKLRIVYENKIPAEIIKADSFLRPVFRWLKNNKVIMITGDGTGTKLRIGKHHLFNFFRQNVWFPLGPANLAEKTKAELLPMIVTPGTEKPYKVIIEKPIHSNLRADEKAIDMTRQFIGMLEHYIINHPEYMHFLDRFYPGCLIENNENKFT